MDRRMDRQLDGWRDGRTDGRTEAVYCHVIVRLTVQRVIQDGRVDLLRRQFEGEAGDAGEAAADEREEGRGIAGHGEQLDQLRVAEEVETRELAARLGEKVVEVGENLVLKRDDSQSQYRNAIFGN